MKRLLQRLVRLFRASHPANPSRVAVKPHSPAPIRWQTLHDMQQGSCADVRLHFILRADINQRTLLRYIAAGESMECTVSAGRRRDTAIHGLLLEFDDMRVISSELQYAEAILWKRGKS